MIRRQSLQIFLRRAWAFLAFVGLIGASLERLIPDVHDGDVPTTQIADIDGDHSAGSTDHGLPNEPASHPVPHIYHCGHAHGLAVRATTESNARLTAARDVVDSPSDNLVSVSIQPHQRPPIA